MAEPRQLVDLLAGLLDIPEDSSAVGLPAPSSKNLREVEADTRMSVDDAFALALRAGLGEAGLNGGASFQLLDVDAARTFGHLGGIPRTVAALHEPTRLAP